VPAFKLHRKSSLLSPFKETVFLNENNHPRSLPSCKCPFYFYFLPWRRNKGCRSSFISRAPLDLKGHRLQYCPWFSLPHSSLAHPYTKNKKKKKREAIVACYTHTQLKFSNQNIFLLHILK